MVGRHPSPFKRGKRSQKNQWAPCGPCGRKCRPKTAGENCRPKIAGQKCRQKHADMSPPQSPAQRVPIGRCARTWRVCRFRVPPQSFHAACPDWPLRVESWRVCRIVPRHSLQHSVSRLAAVLGAGGCVGLGPRPSLQRNVSRLAVALGAGGSVGFPPPQPPSPACPDCPLGVGSWREPSRWVLGAGG